MSSLIMMVAPTPARRDHHAGAHNVATLVPRHWEHLWAGTLDVSQPLLDADMERHHVHGWGASNARHRRLQRRRMYLLLARKGSSSFGQAKRRFLMVPAGRTSRLREYSRAAVRSESAVSHYVSRCEPRTSSLHRTRSCSLLPFAQKLCAADQN